MDEPSKITKKQHWVPQFYLKHFADENDHLYVYNRKADRFHTTNTRDTCSSNYLYEVKRRRAADAAANRFINANKIENRLSKLENFLSPLYEDLIECCELGNLQGVNFFNDRYAISFLFAILIERHPLAIEERRASAAAIAQDYIRAGKLTGDEAERLKRHGLDGELEGATEEFALETSLFSLDHNPWLKRISSRLNKMRLIINKAPVGVEFIATSLPLFIDGGTNNRDVGFEPKVAFIPLDSRYAALFVDEEGPDKLQKISICDVGRYNSALLIAHSAWEHAFAQSRGPLESSVRDWRILV